MGKGSTLQLLPVLNETYSEAGESYKVEHSFACMTASREIIGEASPCRPWQGPRASAARPCTRLTSTCSHAAPRAGFALEDALPSVKLNGSTWPGAPGRARPAARAALFQPAARHAALVARH